MFMERPHLRFDGLYVSRNTYIRTGALSSTHPAATTNPAQSYSDCPFCSFVLLYLVVTNEGGNKSGALVLMMGMCVTVRDCGVEGEEPGAPGMLLPLLQVLPGRHPAVPHLPRGPSAGAALHALGAQQDGGGRAQGQIPAQGEQSPNMALPFLRTSHCSDMRSSHVLTGGV